MPSWNALWSERREPVDQGVTTAVEIEHVSKTYHSRHGEVQALHDVSFNVRGQEFVSIVGPSGCSKSTLLKLIAGVMPLTRGRIALAGTAVRGPAYDLGMVFQTPLLLEWRDVLGNIMLPIEMLGRARKKGELEARRLIEMVGLGGFERAYPHELSGGCGSASPFVGRWCSTRHSC